MDTFQKKQHKMTLDDFNKIENLSQYEGYYWYSDSENPILDNFGKLEAGTIPFVIEGYLYNNTKQHSIAIKNYNGEYVITEFYLNDINAKEYNLLEEVKFPAHKLEGIKHIIFRELQQKETDDLDFFFWKKVANIFVGFEK